MACKIFFEIIDSYYFYISPLFVWLSIFAITFFDVKILADISFGHLLVLILKAIHNASLSYRVSDSIGEIFRGIRCYFDKALPVMLLYGVERKQFHNAIVDDVSPSTIYGADHLLRLFGTCSYVL